MEGRKYPIPTWVWEMRSRTMSFLKRRRDLIDTHNEYLDLKFKKMNRLSEGLNRIVDSRKGVKRVHTVK